VTVAAFAVPEPTAEGLERAVVGALLRGWDPEPLGLTGEHLTDPVLRAVLAAVLRLRTAGAPIDAATVLADLTDHREVRRGHLDAPLLADLLATSPAGDPGWHVGRLGEFAKVRQLRHVGERLLQATRVSEGESLMEEARRVLDAVPSPSGRVAPDLDAFIEEQPVDSVPVIPGLIERGERVIVTGGEGSGKSTLLRQIAVAAGAGWDPFTIKQIRPVRVLLLDAENASRHLRAQLASLRAIAAPATGMLHVASRPEGLDLLADEDLRWVRAQLDAIRPDLLVAGPVYKLASGDPTREVDARLVAAVFDGLRATYDLALILEAHQPYAAAGADRVLRPYGASLWSRWPETGVHLAASGRLTHWRAQREHHDWPAALARGGPGEWPWVADPDAAATPTAGSGHQRKVLDALRTAPLGMSNAQIREVTGIRARESVSRALNALLRDGAVERADVDGDRLWLVPPAPP
jgi:hypothetical protein